jgi:hypothetical protein
MIVAQGTASARPRSLGFFGTLLLLGVFSMLLLLGGFGTLLLLGCATQGLKWCSEFGIGLNIAASK